MATIETLQRKLESNQKKLGQLRMKLNRIESAEATGWEKNPYGYTEYDKVHVQREIEDVTKTIDVIKQSLENEQSKSDSRNIKVILDFLDNWKREVFSYYRDIINDYFNAREMLTIRYQEAKEDASQYRVYSQEYEEIMNAYRDWRANNFDCKLNGYTRYASYKDSKGFTRTKSVKYKDGEWECIKPYITGKSLEEALVKLRKDLNNEANAKYDYLVSRVLDIVGTITDASGLYIGNRGDLNGVIIGTNGKARVETIGAGGYNQDTVVNERRGQRFHFRCLVKPVK